METAADRGSTGGRAQMDTTTRSIMDPNPGIRNALAGLGHGEPQTTFVPLNLTPEHRNQSGNGLDYVLRRPQIRRELPIEQQALS